MKRGLIHMYSKKKWIVMIVSMVFMLGLVACSDTDGDEKEVEEEEEEKTVVFSDALEQYSVWFYVHGEPNEPTKDSTILEMYVFEEEQVQQFDLESVEITLGEVSEYSDEELISYVEEELSTALDSYEEPEAESYTLDIHLVDEDESESGEEETDFIDIVIDEEDIAFVAWEKPILQTIDETNFTGLVNDGDPNVDADKLFITKVDEPSLTITLDEPDSTKSVVTVQEWMERQKQKDLKGQDLTALDAEVLEEMNDHPGAVVYAENCLSCHGENLEGSIGPDLTLAGDRFSEEELQDIIQNGKDNMPPIMSDNEEDAIVLAEWISEFMKED